MELIDAIFDAASMTFSLVGVAIMLLGITCAALLTRFHSRAGEVMAKVTAHENVELYQDSETGHQRTRYQPVFELVSGPHLGARHKSAEVQTRDCYPAGSIWPAKYDPKSGKIRTHRALDPWPYMCGIMILVGAAFIIVPQLQGFSSQNGLGYAFAAIGAATFASGIIAHFTAKRRAARAVEVMARLIAIDISRDSDGDRHEHPVLRILTSAYQGVESTDVHMGDVSEDDIGQEMRGWFDPHSGRIEITEGRMKGGSIPVPLLVTGTVFAALGGLFIAGIL